MVLSIIWGLYRMILFFTKRNIVMSPGPTIEDTNTSSSIVITEDCGSKKVVHNVNKQTERSQNLISKRVTRAKKIMSRASDDSVMSRNSFGFTPSIRTVAPLTNRGRRNTQNFLMLLDSLEPIEDVEAKKRRRKPFTATSSSGIEPTPSDETASQTLIGKEVDRVKDLGAIKLDYIRSQGSRQ